MGSFLRRSAGLGVAAASLASAAGVLTAFGYSWAVPNQSDWAVDGTGQGTIMRLLTGHEPPASGPRRPFNFAIAQTTAFRRVHIEADVKALGRSVMIVYAYVDPAHFDYAHLSSDTAAIQIHHNGIFHVYGGERVRISAPAGPASFPPDHAWHHAVFDWDGQTGAVSVSVDDHTVPALHAVDLSLAAGKVGLGSFDETGEFKNVKLSGS